MGKDEPDDIEPLPLSIPVICSQARVAHMICLFPERTFFNWSIKMKRQIAVMQSI